MAFNRSDALSVPGQISGPGSVSQVGSGTTSLTADNSYTGGTTISAGTLQLGDGGTSGSILGDVTNNATLAFNRSNALTFGGVVLGSGEVKQVGNGTTTFTTNQTYSGGTTISAGTLQLGDGGTSGSILGDVTNNATLAFNRSDVLTYDGAISGAGVVTQAGSGTTTFTADQTYSGGTTISAGVLQLGDGGTAGSILGNVANAGVLAFNRSDALTYGGLISGAGSVSQLGAGTTIFTGSNSYTGGTTISSGTLQLGAGGTSGSIVGNVTNNATLAFNRSDALGFGGTISGSGAVNQLGAGTTVLTADNSYSGATNVTAGTLLINGDQSAATGLTSVGTGGALGGSGIVGGSVAVADGRIAPGAAGAAPGTLGQRRARWVFGKIWA